MNQPINDGGPAFPVEGCSSGITKRDYFAAAAMQAIIASTLSEGTKTGYDIGKPTFLECLSLDAYAHADAMINARKVKP